MHKTITIAIKKSESDNVANDNVANDNYADIDSAEIVTMTMDISQKKLK